MMTDYRPHIRELGRAAHHSGQIRRFKVYGGDSNFHLPKISLPHTGCGKTRQAGDRGGESCLWTEFVRWLHPCTRGFSTANADILSLNYVTVCHFENKRSYKNQSI